jgi:hypothetical protein
MATYLFRIDYAESRQTDGTLVLTEEARGLWRVREGDRLVLGRGRGNAFLFESLATVVKLDVRRLDTPGERRWPRYEYTIGLGEVSAFPQARLLGDLRYSLTRVSHLADPWRNLRHHGVLDSADVETLRAGRLAVSRTIYLGLLRHLSPNVRAAVESQARVLMLSRRAERYESPSEAEGEVYPVHELLEVLERAIVASIRIASEMHKQWTILGWEKERIIAEREEQASRWDLREFAATAGRNQATIEERLLSIAAASATGDTEFERGATWRPHRW